MSVVCCHASTQNNPYVLMMLRLLSFLSLCMLPWLLGAADKIINVSVTDFDKVAYYPQGSAPASVISLNEATLAAQIESSIEAIPVQVAETVNEGELLVQLDCRSASANHDSAAAKYSLAQYQLQRATELNKSKHISEEVLRTRQSELEVARSVLRITQIDVERCQVRAPFKGVVTERIAALGEWVSRGQPLLRLVDLAHVEVSAQIPDSQVNDISQVEEYSLVINGRVFPLMLRVVSENVENLSRTREVRFRFDSQAAQPGQTGRLVWKSTQRHLPADYLVKRKQDYGVFVYKDGRAQFIVVPDAEEGRPFHVRLPENVQLINHGRYSVQDNDAVNVTR